MDWILTKQAAKLIQALVDIATSLKELVEIEKQKH